MKYVIIIIIVTRCQEASARGKFYTMSVTWGVVVSGCSETGIAVVMVLYNSGDEYRWLSEGEVSW